MADSPASPRAERIRAAVLTALLMAALIVRVGVSPRPGQPPHVPITQAETWMADALTGIGAKTRAAMAVHIRAGEIDALPARARTEARAFFSGWPAE